MQSTSMARRKHRFGHRHFRGRHDPPLFIRRALGYKLIFKLTHKALHRPGAGFAKGANGPATGDVVGDTDQIVRIGLAALAMTEAVESFAHPERTFATRGALTT